MTPGETKRAALERVRFLGPRPVGLIVAGRRLSGRAPETGTIGARGSDCDWWLAKDGDAPVGVVVSRQGRHDVTVQPTGVLEFGPTVRVALNFPPASPAHKQAGDAGGGGRR